MTLRILPVLCGLAILLAAPNAHARADHREAPLIRPLTVEQVNWGGMISRAPARVSGLPTKTGRRRYEPITIIKRPDRASPMLRRAHKSRRALPRVVLKGRNASGKTFAIVLKKARIVSISPYMPSSSSRPRLETIKIVPHTVSW